MPRKIHKLKVASSPFALLAISSAESRHKLAWMINQSLGLNIRDAEPIIQNQDTQYPVQRDDQSDPEVNYSLITNRHEGNVLIRELANIDYILRIEGVIIIDLIKSTVKSIRSLDGVTAVIEVNPQKVKLVRLLEG